MKNSHLKEVTTEDGTITLYNEKFKEACHSASGATNETITHYFEGCKVAEKLENSNKIKILEVGFGTGNGFVTTFRQIKACNLDHKQILFTSLEIDIENILWAKLNYPELKELNIDTNPIELDLGNIHLQIYIGDARDSVDKLNNTFDCIYQDAFSPKRNPRLWTVQWFKQLKKVSHPETIMSTYSASSSIRKSMREAGWILYSGVRFGTKRSSTRATLNGEHDSEILSSLERSPAIIITDDNAEDYRKKDD